MSDRKPRVETDREFLPLSSDMIERTRRSIRLSEFRQQVTEAMIQSSLEQLAGIQARLDRYNCSNSAKRAPVFFQESSLVSQESQPTDQAMVAEVNFRKFLSSITGQVTGVSDLDQATHQDPFYNSPDQQSGSGQ